MHLPVETNSEGPPVTSPTLYLPTWMPVGRFAGCKVQLSISINLPLLFHQKAERLCASSLAVQHWSDQAMSTSRK